MEDNHIQEIIARVKSDKPDFYGNLKVKQIIVHYEQQINHLYSLLEKRKVKLPRKVAEAIDTCKGAGLRRFGIITSMDRISSLFRDYSKPVLDSLACIRDYAWRNQEVFMEALVNGYEIEDEPMPLVLDIAGMILEWEKSPYTGDPQTDRERLAQRILERLGMDNAKTGG